MNYVRCPSAGCTYTWQVYFSPPEPSNGYPGDAEVTDANDECPECGGAPPTSEQAFSLIINSRPEEDV